MKFFTAKYFSLMLLLSAVTGGVQANRADDGDSCEKRSDCGSCFSCYECGCNPLYCGAWDLQIQGGVAPIRWHKFQNYQVNCAPAVHPTKVEAAGRELKFKDLFKIPWTVGGQVGYHWSDNTRAYVEFNYVQANAKKDVITGQDGTSGALNLRKYKLFDGYAGVRYYFDRWCDRVSFFLGGKVGFTHHKRVTIDNWTFNNFVVLVGTDNHFSNSSTSVAGGFNLGFDVCFCGNWSLVVTGEVVASCGPNRPAFIQINQVQTPFSASAFLPAHIGNELRFPITAGIRYSF